MGLGINTLSAVAEAGRSRMQQRVRTTTMQTMAVVFQFTYFATNTGVGLQIWERGDDYVDPGNPPFLQDDGEPPRQLGGHFKIVSTDGDEAHVTKFRFFAFSHQFARTQMSIFARYRNGRP